VDEGRREVLSKGDPLGVRGGDHSRGTFTDSRVKGGLWEEERTS
jgi:hypothetical protein